MKEEWKALEACQIGDVVSREIIDIRTGVILCSKGYIFSADSVKWLKKFLYSDIYISKNTWEHVWGISQEEKAHYREGETKVKKLFLDLEETKVLDKQKVKAVEEQFEDILKSNKMIMGCVNILKDLDEYVYAHSINVGLLAVLIGRWMKLEVYQLDELFLAGILHDVGKYRVPAYIVNKKECLTPVESKIMQKHVLHGYDLIKDATDVTAMVKVGVLTHHERIDGSGYPKQLRGEDIPLFGKIIAVADEYDEIVSQKIFAARQTPFDAMEYLLRQEIGKLDTDVLLTFLRNIADYYIGVYVKLNTGAVGEIVFINGHCVYKPIVKVGDTYIDLSQERNVWITKIV